MSDNYQTVFQDEEKRHKEHVERVMARLRQEKDAWFLSRSARYISILIIMLAEKPMSKTLIMILKIWEF